MSSLPVQIVTGLITLAALVFTVLAYPARYGALSGRSRLFRTIGVGLTDLLLMLVLLATFIDWKGELQSGASQSSVKLRFAFYVSSCLLLCMALMCVAALDALESFSVARRERRLTLEKILREQVDQARAEALESAKHGASSPSQDAGDNRDS